MSHRTPHRFWHPHGWGFLLVSSLAVLLLWIVASPACTAQPSLTLHRAVVNYPTVRLYFTVRCDSIVQRTFSIHDFRIFDDGIEVPGFSIQCLPFGCPFSVGLVLDASNSMTGAATDVISGASGFINSMEAGVDEAAVVLFNQSSSIAQHMTADQSALLSAVAQMTIQGHTGWRDATYEGIMEVADRASHQTKALILVSNGGDNTSTHSTAELIDSALHKDVRIFSIIVGGGPDYEDMILLSDTTGGVALHAAQSSMIPSRFAMIYDILKDCECSLEYKINCPDGSENLVELQLVNYCGGNDTAYARYRVPLMPELFQELRMHLSEAWSYGGRDVTLTLRSENVPPDLTFYPLTFLLHHDPVRMPLKSVRIPPSSILSGMSVTATPAANGTRIRMAGRSPLADAGILLECTFHPEPRVSDTVCHEIWAVDPAFEEGCLIPVIDTGRICVLPDQAEVSCQMTGPTRVSWSHRLQRYAPDVFPVTVMMQNQGTRDAEGMRLQFSVDTSVVRVLSFVSDSLTGTNDTLCASQELSATWMLEPLPQIAQDTVEICVTATFANHAPVRCCMTVPISAAGPELDCSLVLPVLEADSVHPRYVPERFPVRVDVMNHGVVPSDSVMATLVLPADLQLDGSDLSGSMSKFINPAMLQPSEQGSVFWTVRHLPRAEAHRDTILVYLTGTDGSETHCSTELLVPALRLYRLGGSCLIPDSLLFDRSTGTYTPAPFTAEVTLTNHGISAAHHATATILLPPEVTFDPPGQPITKAWPDSILPWQPGDSINVMDWTLRWTGRYPDRRSATITFVLAARTGEGAAFDTAVVSCPVSAAGIPDSLYCELRMMDSLHVSDGTSLSPNPFPVRYFLRNDGYTAVDIDSIEILITDPLLHLHPTSPHGMKVPVGVQLQSGETISWEWFVSANGTDADREAMIRAWIIDGEGNRLHCENSIHIPAIAPDDIVCDLTIPSIRVDRDSARYEPMPFPVVVTVSNYTQLLSDSIQVELHLPAGFQLAGQDAPDRFRKFIVPGRLFPGQSGSAAWWVTHPRVASMRMEPIQVSILQPDSVLRFCEGLVSIPAFPSDVGVNLVADGPLRFCDRDSVTLDAGEGWVAYRWNTGETSRVIVIRKSGSYFCHVRDGNGWMSYSDTLTVTVDPMPSKPIVWQDGTLLRCIADTGVTFQWFRDDQEINRAVNDTLHLMRIGQYRVKVTNGEGCATVSDPFDVTTLAIRSDLAPAGYSLHCWPEPARERLHIEARIPTGKRMSLVLVDLLGRKTVLAETVLQDGEFRTTVDFPEPGGAGVWLCVLRSGDVLKVQRITRLK